LDSITEFWNIARHGGISLALIGVCSLLAVFVGIERALALWGVQDGSRKLAESVSRSLYRGDVAEARAACERSRTPLADVLLGAFTRFGKVSPDALLRAVDRERSHVLLRLRARLWILGTIGATAPFVGLFGTVVGIMRAFKDMAAHPGGGFAVVAAGISEALVATAAGIAVAIESVVLYNFFSSRISATVLEMKLAADEVMELLVHPREAPREPDAPAPGVAGAAVEA
jgi:biopolymer transport protein ExbB